MRQSWGSTAWRTLSALPYCTNQVGQPAAAGCVRGGRAVAPPSCCTLRSGMLSWCAHQARNSACRLPAATLPTPSAGNFNLSKPFGIFRHEEGANLSRAVRSPSGIVYYREGGPASSSGTAGGAASPADSGGLSTGAIAGKLEWREGACKPDVARQRLALLFGSETQPSPCWLPPGCPFRRHCGGSCCWCSTDGCRRRLGAGAEAPAEWICGGSGGSGDGCNQS